MTDAAHLAAMHPWLRQRVSVALDAWRDDAPSDETIRLVESVRSLATQQEYYRSGRSRADGVTRLSLHQFAPALAADVAVLRAGRYVAQAADPAWQRWGVCAHEQGLSWGGDWQGLVDCPHVEVSEVERVRLAQLAAGATPDGVWGRATERAIGGPFRPGSGSGWGRMTLAAWAGLTHG